MIPVVGGRICDLRMADEMLCSAPSMPPGVCTETLPPPPNAFCSVVGENKETRGPLYGCSGPVSN